MVVLEGDLAVVWLGSFAVLLVLVLHLLTQARNANSMKRLLDDVIPKKCCQR